jgi:3-oxoacyl-[acyl-carrier-protein] synthase II
MIPLIVTGLGVVSPVGIGREAFFASMAKPRLLASEPLFPAEAFDAATYPNATIAEVRGFDPAKFLGDKGLRTLDRLTKLLVVAARLAMHDSGLKENNVYVHDSPERIGLCCSNAYGSLEAITELDRVATLEDARYINPAKFPNTVANSAAGYVSIWEDIRALNVSVSDGNCGALDAVACADVFFDTDRADAIVVGGGEAMSEALYLAFHSLGALEDGTRLGEGAVFFVLESAEHAGARNARAMAEIIGYGTSFVGPSTEAPLVHASPDAMERAIASALADAELSATNIDVVASSLSGVRAFDDAELAAIRRVLGEGVCVAAPKMVLGETLGASGGMGMAAALAWLEGATPAPLVARCDARGRALGEARPIRVRTVLVTSMGFYGNASAIVMRRPDLGPESQKSDARSES